jgi:hypothetical protein
MSENLKLIFRRVLACCRNGFVTFSFSFTSPPDSRGEEVVGY